MFETSEELYSKAIIKNIIEELAEDIHTTDDYGTAELLLEAELQVYEIAFPSLDMNMVEDIVREYLYNHNYLEYSRLVEGMVEVDFDGTGDCLYIKCVDDGVGGDLYRTIDGGDGFFIDVDKYGLVKGVELLGVSDFFGFKEGESVDFVSVSVNVGVDVLRVNVSFFVNRDGSVGRLRQWFGVFVNDDGFVDDFVGCWCLYTNNDV